MHPELQKADIKSFGERYRCSVEEEEDLLEFYDENEGDLTALLETIILSRNEDIPRFVEFLEKQIQGGFLERYESFDQTKNKIRQLPDERSEAKAEK